MFIIHFFCGGVGVSFFLRKTKSITKLQFFAFEIVSLRGFGTGIVRVGDRISGADLGQLNAKLLVELLLAFGEHGHDFIFVFLD
jgi:hypothetical protein